MNEGRPYLQMWRGVWVSFCKIVKVSFLSVRYRSDDLYCRTADTRSSPTMLFIRVGIKYTLITNRVGYDGVPAILQYRSSDLYLTDREETMAILKRDTHTPLHICKLGIPSFILFPHKINFSYKCILMFRATHMGILLVGRRSLCDTYLAILRDR